MKPEPSDTQFSDNLIDDLREEILENGTARKMDIQALLRKVDSRLANIKRSWDGDRQQLYSKIEQLQTHIRTTMLEELARIRGAGSDKESCDEEKLRKLAVECFIDNKSRNLGIVFFRKEQETPTVEIDCEQRIPICRAACCHLKASLTKEEAKSGSYRFEPNHPFTLMRSQGSACNYLKDCRCKIYDSRPRACANYNCSKNKAIWEDFEKRIPGPAVRKIQEFEDGLASASETNSEK